MTISVTVAFARDHEYEFKLREGEALPSREEAREWLERQWLELECSTDNPVGKILAIDRILSVARYGGEKRFAQGEDWAREYARAVAVTLGRQAVRVDVAERVVG